MSSSLQGKPDSQRRHVSNEEAAVFPENARPTDESLTVISKTNPVVEPTPSNSDKIIDLSRKPVSPEAIVESLRGKRLAHFELIEPIGVGGMAAVIRARDTQLDRIVALKILPPEMALEQENIQRFHQEARAAAKLDHENIGRVFYCGEDQGLHFIAFEFVEGQNLRTILEKRGRLPVPEAIRLIVQIAAGLEHAATRGVVHRDVKPSNIIITSAGQAKLVDMGLARNMEPRSERDLTQSGMTLGTFDYISPEQALEPREADSRSDIYSLGCTLYHMLTGQPPVPEGTPAKKLQFHQHHAPVDPRDIDPAIPKEMVAILGKMMSKNPKDRYQRPIHLVHHLMQLGHKLGITEGLPEVILVSDAGLPGEPRSRPVLLVGLALAALVAVVLLVSLTGEPAKVVSGTFAGSGGDNPPFKPGGEIKIPKPKASHPEVVRNRKDLEEVLKDTSAKFIKAKIETTKPIDLDGLVFKGDKNQKLELWSDSVEDAIVCLHYEDSDKPIGLVFSGGEEVVLRGIKFELASETTPTQPVAIIAVRGVKKLRIERCIFVQTKVPGIPAPSSTPGSVPRVHLASLLIDAPKDADNPAPIVEIKDCLFDSHGAGGQMAVAINGAADVRVTDSAFKPHGAFFQFREKCTEENTLVSLEHCEGFVVLGPALRFNKGASAHVRNERSGFFRPTGALAPNTGLPEPGLIFLGTDAHLRYEGQGNLYHNLNALVERKKEPLIAVAEEFQEFLRKNKNGSSDKESRHLNQAASPLYYHENPLGRSDNLAFLLKAEHYKQVGLRSTWSGPLPALPNVVVVKKSPEKIVDPGTDLSKPGTYKDLHAALAVAEDGDVIFIKHGASRDVKVAVELRPGISVTLKPFDEDYQPRLIFDTGFAADKDSALFTIKRGSGKLHIKNMEILLTPELADYQSQSMFRLGESAHLVFNNCVLTMRPTNGVKCHVVTFVDLDGMVKMGAGSGSSAKVEFHECFIRGAGDLISLRGSRILPVELNDCLVALDGSLLDIKATDKAMPMEVGVRWKMKRSSVFTAKSVFALHSMAAKCLMETNANVENCLLASLVPAMPAILFEMNPDRPEDMDKCFKWHGTKNYFANFDVLKVGAWKASDLDMKSDTGTLTFPKLDKAMPQKLWDATPDWFRPAETELQQIRNFGISEEVEKRLLPPPLPDE